VFSRGRREMGERGEGGGPGGGGGGGGGWVAWVIGGFGTLFFGQFFFKSIRWLLALV
jgi:hypothetical protein